MKALGFAAILVSVCAMAACTITDGDGGTGGEGGTGGSTSTSTSTTSGAGGEGGEDSGTGGEGGGNECSSLEAQACMTCCSEARPSEAEAFNALTFLHCGCAAESRCAAFCDTTDSTTDVCGEDGEVNVEVNNTDCELCVIEESETGPCYDDAYTACEAAEDCQALTECSNSCE
ncbi:hypothetical protein WMF28_27560 [Sorangium sp. So ce590]|uniref:hypothetical protein n=1 Tax=Sorangium sp. So ce590 TaxID=3133317 RepID=UPI003F638A45